MMDKGGATGACGLSWAAEGLRTGWTPQVLCYCDFNGDIMTAS